MRAVVIDDEKQSRETLKAFLKKYCPEVVLCGEGDSVQTGLQCIKDNDPDLVFLDIKMGDGSGFNLLDKLEKLTFEIIFTTAFDEYAVKAFRFSALDYLLKPIDPDELKNAVEKAGQKRGDSMDSRLDLLLERIQKKESKKISLPAIDGINFINTSDIVRCEAESNYTHFFLTDSTKITVPKTLKEYEEILPDTFCRIHQSHLINLEHLKKYVKGDGGYVIMDDGKEVEVSRRRKDYFLSKI